jgi:hypothetical protein
MALQPLLGPDLFFSFVIFFTQMVGLHGRGISPSQGRYLHTGQHKHRINAHRDIHALSGIWTHDPSFRAGKDSSCLRPRGHCVQPSNTFTLHSFRSLRPILSALVSLPLRRFLRQFAVVTNCRKWNSMRSCWNGL